MIVAIALTCLFALLLLAGSLGLFTRGAAPRRPAVPPRTAAPAGARTQVDPPATGRPPAPGAVDMAEFKRRLLARRWREVLPSLLVILGLLGIMVFGAIAVMLALESATTGVLMLLVALGAAAKIAWDFARA